MLSIASGILLALAMMLVKVSVIDVAVETNIFSIISSPLAWLGALLGLGGFLVMQKAMSRWNLAVTIPTITGVVVLISNALAYYVLNENIGGFRLLGIALILIGLVNFVYAEKK